MKNEQINECLYNIADEYEQREKSKTVWDRESMISRGIEGLRIENVTTVNRQLD